MKIIIVCYPRVGSRYLTKKLNTCINPHPDDQFYNEQYQNDIFNKKVNVFSTHDRNINYLYKNLNLKKTDVIIHLIANPYNSITSFFNAWPQKEYKNNNTPKFKLKTSEIKPMPMHIIENCDNSFAVQGVHYDCYVYDPAIRPIIKFTPSDIQKFNYQELMLRCDFLQHENHFDTVINNNLDFRMITIKYEGLKKQENINKFKNFLGKGFESINFDDFTPRKSNWQNSVFKDEIENVYGSLYKKYTAMPDVKIWR